MRSVPCSRESAAPMVGRKAGVSTTCGPSEQGTPASRGRGRGRVRVGVRVRVKG